MMHYRNNGDRPAQMTMGYELTSNREYISCTDHPGLSKRELIAIEAMKCYLRINVNTRKEIAEASVMMADELLKKLES